MATILVVPIAPGVAHQSQTTTLDGRPFEIRLDWIGRIERWTISIEGIVQCKGLCLGADLLRQYRHDPAAPQGTLVLVDTQGGDVEPDLYSLGVRQQLWYVSE